MVTDLTSWRGFSVLLMRWQAPRTEQASGRRQGHRQGQRKGGLSTPGTPTSTAKLHLVSVGIKR